VQKGGHGSSHEEGTRRVLPGPSRPAEQFLKRCGRSRCQIRVVIRGSDNILRKLPFTAEATPYDGRSLLSSH
jgi:hypothetical protein